MEHSIILQLDDHILLNIFNNLSLSDICSIATTCLRFLRLTQNIFHRRYKIFDTIDELPAISTPNLIVIGKCIGQHVRCLLIDLKKLQKYKPKFLHNSEDYADFEHNENITYTINDINELFNQFLQLIPLYFTVLIDIQIGYNIIRPFDNNSKENELQKCLTIINTHISDKHIQDIYDYWKFQKLYIHLPDLHKEDNREWSGLKGSVLTKINDIHTLVMKYCRRIKPQYFYDFCINNCDTVNELQIIDCNYLEENQVTFEQIGKCLKNLEKFQLTLNGSGGDDPNLMPLSSLKKLNYLHLTMITDIDELICQLSEIDNLEHLYVIDCLIEFNKISHHIMFTKLKTIDLRGCTIDGKFLIRLGDMNKCLSEIQINYTSSEDDSDDLNDELLTFIKCSNNLETMHLVCFYEMITSEFFENICKILSNEFKHNHNRSKLQLHLALEDYAYCKDVLIETMKDIDRLTNEYCKFIKVFPNFIIN